VRADIAGARRRAGRDNAGAMSRDIAARRQDAVLRALRDAGDRPVSLVELRERGIGNPGAVIYELELAGYEIDRVHRHGRLLGVRLGARDEPRVELRRRRRFL
jgi:cytosine/adenosine deaminase-related metal-dependent hydrolase